MTELTAMQKIAILTRNRSDVAALSNAILEEVAITHNGSLQIPIYKEGTNRGLAIYNLIAEDLLGEMPAPRSDFRRVFVTMKGYSMLLNILEGINRDEARESMKGTMPNAFEITQQH